MQLNSGASWPKRALQFLSYLIRFRWYNRMSWWYLFGSFLCLTVGASLVYYLLSAKALPGDGIYTSCQNANISWFDSLYFSVATETTVGYGDLAPQGLSRLAACLQVLGGLALVGLVVDKITSGPGMLLKTAVERCSGDWIELTYIREENTLVVSLLTIAYVDESLRYDGDNFDQNGKPLGFFRGYLQENSRLDNNKISFEYSNRHSETRFFDKGVTDLEFTDLESGRYRKFVGQANDETMKIRKFHGGYRASPQESRIIRSTRPEVQGQLARHWAETFCRETGHSW